MITKVKNSCFENPRENRSHPVYSDEKMMSNRQKNLLTELVFSRLQDREAQEHLLNQINDELTAVDAEDLIFSLIK